MAGASVGSLVAKLGLDAAEFTRGISKAERDAVKLGDSIQNSIIDAKRTIRGLFVGFSVKVAVDEFNKLLDVAAKFQDLSETTGETAVNLASFATVAAGAGKSVDDIANAMNKLTKNLVGVDDEGKAAGAAIEAIGLGIEDFKKLSPAEQFESVGRALSGYADGASKVAVAQALYGKTGAELLKVFKELEAEGGRTNILTAEQIKLADDYRDKQAVLTSQIQQYASALSTQAIPALTAFSGVVVDAAKRLFDLGSTSDQLGQNQGVASFAEAAISRLAFVVDAVQGVQVVFSRLGEFIGATAAAIEAKVSGSKAGLKEIQDSYGKSLETSKFKSVQDAFQESLAKQKQAVAVAQDPEVMRFAARAKAAEDARKKILTYNGAAKAVKTGGAGKDTAAQEAKAQLALDLDAIKNAQEAITNSYANQEKILEALRSAGLKEEGAYYQEKQRFIAQNAAAQEDSFQKQIARLQQEQLSGKDAIDNAKKIADVEAKLQKVRQDSAASAQVLSIQQTAAYTQMRAAILSAQQAAQDFFDTTNRGYAREIAGIGQGTKARGFSSGITQIEDKYRDQRQALQNQRSQQELAGGFGPEAKKQFDAQLQIINDFQAKAIDSYKSYYGTINEAQSNWLNGATEALRNYSDEASNVAKHTEEAFTKAFKGLEDQFVNLFSGKKFDFKKLFGDITGDVTRNFVKESITGPLAKLAGDSLGDGGLLAGFFGGGNKKDPLGGRGSSASNPLFVTDGVGGLLGSGSSSSGSGLIGSLFGSLGSSYSSADSSGLEALISSLSGRASGGSVRPYGMHRVNENGPELFDYRGKQYLLNGPGNGMVTATENMQGAGFSQANTFVLEGRIDRSTQSQIVNKVRRQTLTATARLA